MFFVCFVWYFYILFFICQSFFSKERPHFLAGEMGPFCCALQTSDTLFKMKKFSVLSLAHPGLDLSTDRAELSVINALHLLSARDVVAYGTVAVDVIDIALRRMIGSTFLGHNTPPSIAASFAFKRQ
jgi:hypothetical protein